MTPGRFPLGFPGYFEVARKGHRRRSRAQTESNRRASACRATSRMALGLAAGPKWGSAIPTCMLTENAWIRTDDSRVAGSSTFLHEPRGLDKRKFSPCAAPAHGENFLLSR